MSFRRFVVWMSTAALACLTSATVSGGSAAASVDASADPAISAEHCVMVVGKAATANAISPVLFSYCAGSQEEASAHLFSPAVRAKLGAKAVMPDDLLMTWFEHADYDADGLSTNIYGSAGTCDSAGYRIEPNFLWKRILSSAAGFAQCNAAKFTNRALNFAKSWRLPINNLGEALNDNVGLVNVWHV